MERPFWPIKGWSYPYGFPRTLDSAIDPNFRFLYTSVIASKMPTTPAAMSAISTTWARSYYESCDRITAEIVLPPDARPYAARETFDKVVQ
jgi:hypothetical protein